MLAPQPSAIAKSVHWYQRRWLRLVISLALLASLLSAASQEPNPARAKQLTEAAQYMARAVRLAKEELSRDWNAIPNDADPECRCKTTKEHSLPRGLETQLLNTL